MTKLQEQRTQQAFLENEAAERETERKLAKAKANKVEEEETEEEEEEDEEELVDLVKCESMENLTKQVKRELELSDRLDKSLLRFLLHSFFIICILIILRRKITVIICPTHSERDNQSSVLGGDSLDYNLDELSQHIVERLLARIQDNGRQD